MTYTPKLDAISRAIAIQLTKQNELEAELKTVQANLKKLENQLIDFVLTDNDSLLKYVNTLQKDFDTTSNTEPACNGKFK